MPGCRKKQKSHKSRLLTSGANRRISPMRAGPLPQATPSRAHVSQVPQPAHTSQFPKWATLATHPELASDNNRTIVLNRTIRAPRGSYVPWEPATLLGPGLTTGWGSRVKSRSPGSTGVPAEAEEVGMCSW